MAVNYVMTLKNSRMQAVIDAIGSAGKMVIGTSALSGATGVLATLTLASPAFTLASGVITLAGVPRSATAAATGTAAKAELRTSADASVVTGLTVGTSATDFIINSTSISTGQTVQCTAGTITHSA